MKVTAAMVDRAVATFDDKNVKDFMHSTLDLKHAVLESAGFEQLVVRLYIRGVGQDLDPLSLVASAMLAGINVGRQLEKEGREAEARGASEP